MYRSTSLARIPRTIAIRISFAVSEFDWGSGIWSLKRVSSCNPAQSFCTHQQGKCVVVREGSTSIPGASHLAIPA